MAKQTKINYTANDRAIVAALKGNEGMTLAQINAASGMNLVPGHIVSALKKGLIAKAGEVEVMRDGFRPVSTYTFITAEPGVRSNGKVYEYSDTESAILKAASGIEGNFTLAELSAAAGFEVKTGSTNTLIRKGNIAKADQIKKAVKIKSSVSVYMFVKDIPTEE